MTESKNLIDWLRSEVVDPTQRSFDNLTTINAGYGRIDGLLPKIQNIIYHQASAVCNALSLPVTAAASLARAPGTAVSLVSGLIRGTSDVYRRILLAGQTKVDAVLKKPQMFLERIRPSESKI